MHLLRCSKGDHSDNRLHGLDNRLRVLHRELSKKRSIQMILKTTARHTNTTLQHNDQRNSGDTAHIHQTMRLHEKGLRYFIDTIHYVVYSI